MRAAVIRRAGDTPALEEFADPQPGPGLSVGTLAHFASGAVLRILGLIVALGVLIRLGRPSGPVAFNEGNGHFRIQRLPTMVQLSSVNAIRCLDINHDGHPDLVLGGNEFGFLPQFGRLDGSIGDVLLGDGKGNFAVQDPQHSGLDLSGQVRDITTILTKKGIYLLFLQNDEYPVLYALNPH